MGEEGGVGGGIRECIMNGKRKEGGSRERERERKRVRESEKDV